MSKNTAQQGDIKFTTMLLKTEIRPGPSPATEVIDTRQEAVTKKSNNDLLLLYLDRVFNPLMEKSQSKPDAKPKQKPEQDADRSFMFKGPSEADLAALQAFQRQAAGPVALLKNVGHDICLGGRIKSPGSIVPRPCLGPPLFVGFDCEWVSKSPGHNRILSIQFYVVGPTGERHTKVIDLSGPEAVDTRPSLAEALDDLLEECDAECVFDEWPCEVVLVGFFTRADITVFSDFRKFRDQLDGIGGSLATVIRPAEIELPLSENRNERLKWRYTRVLGDAFNPRLMSVRLIDASRLAPPGSSLANIGTWLNIEKRDLPPGYSKDDMARFQREKPETFHEYAVRDAEVAVMYILWVLWFCDRFLGLKGLSATVSGLAVRLVELCMIKDGVDPNVALNFENTKRTIWGTRSGRPVTIKKREPIRTRKWFEAFLADMYQGGRNECFMFGPTNVKTYYDPDLTVAYVAGLVYAMTMDYDKVFMTNDVEHFKGHVAGYANVRFRFPAGTRFPCLPVTLEDRGLWFPLSGESLCTAPEIELALAMGATIEILFGIVIPWAKRESVFARSKAVIDAKRAKAKKSKAKVSVLLKASSEPVEGVDDVFIPVEEMQFPPESHGDDGYRMFESFAIYVRKMRSRFERKSLPFEFMKLVGNSAYGKTGQGFKSKRTFVPKVMGSMTIGQSRISEAAIAALVCGFIRAVLGEILWKLPADAQAVSVTTDGMLVDVPLESLDLSGVMCRRFQTMVDRIAPGAAMMELKHQVQQVVPFRTRGQLTGQADGDHAIIVAKAGVKPVLHGDEAQRKAQMEPVNQNKYMLDLLANRYAGQKLPRESMMSMRDQLMNNWDLQTQSNDVALNLEFDFKRRPLPPQMIKIQSTGVDHISWDTEPWDTKEEGELVRTVFDQWRKHRVMKAMTDDTNWQAFMGFFQSNRHRMAEASKQLALTVTGTDPKGDEAPKSARVRGSTGRVYATKKTSYLGVAIRTFLIAYATRSWGLKDADFSQARLAAWLSEMGYPVAVHSIKNAGRSRLNEQVVCADEEVMAFLNLMKSRFPGLEIERFLFGR